MTEQDTATEEPVIVMATVHPANDHRMPEGVEERVRRLEDAVASLQDTRALEERVVARVSERIDRTRPQPTSTPADIVVSASRRLLPMAAELLRPAPDPVAMPARGPHSPPLPPPDNGRRPWVLLEVWNELRWLFHMMTNRQYRLTMSGMVAVYLLLPLIVFSSLLTYVVPLLGLVPNVLFVPLDKVFDLALAFVAFKLLTRELSRYRSLMVGESA